MSSEIEEEIRRVFCECELQNLLVLPPEALNPLLFQVIRFHSLPLLKWLVERGADLNCVLEKGVTPLHYACQEGDIGIADYLVKAGALSLAVCDRGFTALTYACQSLSLPMVKWACKLGCDPNHRDRRGFTVLNALVANPDAKEKEAAICSIIEYLLQEGARCMMNVYPTPGMLAEANGFHQAAALLRKQTPRPSLLASPFSLAFTEELTMLLDQGADINERHPEGWTPLADAIMRGLMPSAFLLLDRGADIKVIDEMGWTLLHYLAVFGSGQEAVKLAAMLISRGCDVNVKCFAGNTPLKLSKDPELSKLFSS